MADLEHHIALSPDSVLEAGSISKQFTAAAVLLLAEQGKLSLRDPVRKFLPELPDYGTTITIEQLIHHTSGLRDWGSVAEVQGWPRSTRKYSNAWVLEIAAHQKALNYKPGDEWSYTNTGYNLLAIIVQRVSGKSLAEFTHEHIFAPLGMQTTSWRDDFQRIVENRAVAYEISEGREHELMPFENAYGNGGLLTTVDDLLRWNERFDASGRSGEASMGGSSFVQSELVPGKLNDGRTLFYAAGLMLADHHGMREVSHSGATAGYRAWLGFYPDQKLSVAVLCNAAEADSTSLGHQVADVYLPHTSPRAAGSTEPALMAGVEGLYESRRDHTTLSIELKDGKLLAQGKLPLIADSATSFYLRPESATYQLTTDAAGKVTGMRVVSMGYEMDTFDKVERAHPTESELQPMTGEYVADEAETAFQVVLTPKGLEIHQRPDSVFPLKPTYTGGFASEFGSIRFLRDSSGKVTGISLGDSRLWDLRFRRLDARP